MIDILKFNCCLNPHSSLNPIPKFILLVLFIIIFSTIYHKAFFSLDIFMNFNQSNRRQNQ